MQAYSKALYQEFSLKLRALPGRKCCEGHQGDGNGETFLLTCPIPTAKLNMLCIPPHTGRLSP